MAHILDEIARILASPMPRRDAMKAMGKALGVGLLALVGADKAFGICSGFGCGANCCSVGQTCCSGGFRPPFCAPAGRQCCSDSTCALNETCCDLACCAPGQSCISLRCGSSLGGFSLG